MLLHNKVIQSCNTFILGQRNDEMKPYYNIEKP